MMLRAFRELLRKNGDIPGGAHRGYCSRLSTIHNYCGIVLVIVLRTGTVRIVVFFRRVASEDNAADAPSRGEMPRAIGIRTVKPRIPTFVHS